MAKIVELPRLSDTMQEGVIARWHITEGDKVKRGQVIAEIETDKATMEFESFDAGNVLKLVAAEGEALPLGAPIAVLGKPGEDPDQVLAQHGRPSGDGGSGKSAAAPAAAQAGQPSVASTTSPAEPAAAQEGDQPPVASTTSRAEPSAVATSGPAPEAEPQDAELSGRVPASPLARRLAREHDLTLEAIEGSGPHGRIVKADVEAAARIAQGSPVMGKATADIDEHGRPYVSRPAQEVALTQMRKAIARRMSDAFRDVPHFYLTAAIDMERAVGLRAEYNEAVSGTKVSINDLLVLAAAKGLRLHPRVNAAFSGSSIVRHGDVHIGVAVALDDGLVVPVVRYADQKTLRAISLETRDLGKRAKKRQLEPEEMSGSTFTISNLGMFGIDHFSAVINPGEGAILAVGQVAPAVTVDDRGEFVARRQMKVTIACDHRAMDGSDGAKFLQTFKGLLERPLGLFA